MSEEEQEIVYQDHEMLEEIDPNGSTICIISGNDINIEETKPKKRAPKGLGEARYTKQKFCSRWLLEYPWLRQNPSDDSVSYCSICKRELVSKKSHLERHQRSFKHMRLQGFENVYTFNQPEADLIEAHTSGYLDNDNDNNDDDFHDEDMFDEVEDGYTTIKVEPTKAVAASTPILVRKFETKPSIKKNLTPKNETSNQTAATKTPKMERDLSFKSSTDRKPRDMNMSGYYFGTPQPKKDSFDLFFESISVAVKALPPKLAAEVKSRVSQLVAEFELRAICEKEAEEKAKHAMVTIPTQVGNIVTVDPTMSSGSNQISTNVTNQRTADGTAVTTHYVYSYQPKTQQ